MFTPHDVLSVATFALSAFLPARKTLVREPPNVSTLTHHRSMSRLSRLTFMRSSRTQPRWHKDYVKSVKLPRWSLRLQVANSEWVLESISKLAMIELSSWTSPSRAMMSPLRSSLKKPSDNALIFWVGCGCRAQLCANRNDCGWRKVTIFSTPWSAKAIHINGVGRT